MQKDNKIGIITFHASHNCGSFLQAYALQNFLRNHGYPNEIIDFSGVKQQELYQSLPHITNVKTLLKYIILLPHKKLLRNVFSSYNNFIKRNLNLSEGKFSTNQELQKADFKYDIYISGSDQIWNITIEDSDDAYFLNFVQKGKKIAYAPSFGAKSIKKYANAQAYQKYQKLIASYDALSIREKNGQKWLKDMLDKKVPIVLDPTLLLHQKDYVSLEQPLEEKINSPYIFYYSPGYNKQINHLVQQISKKYHLNVVVWSPKSYFTKFMNLTKFYLPKTQNPGIYLSLIKHANLIITTSFHGTIFSTIYKKPFWTIKNGGMFGDDDRVQTLIEQLHIEDRLIPMQFNPNFNYMQTPDYHEYDNALSALRKKSSDFLLGVIGHGK